MLLLLSFVSLPVFAEDVVISDVQVTVLPRDIFVGDDMEIRCTFSYDTPLVPDGLLSIALSACEIQDMTVREVTLQKSDSSYMLSMICVPWILGAIDIPPLLVSEHSADTETQVFLDIPDITVKSIVGYTGVSELRPSKAPLLVPGTTWVIYILSALCLVILVAVVVVIVRFRFVRRKVKQIVSTALIVKNYHSLRYQMKKLVKAKNPVSDREYADIVSHLIREYISCRFAYNFRAETAKGVVEAFDRISCGLFSVETGESVQVLSEVLSRCDYIRFAGDKGEAGSLPVEERREICSSVINAAHCLEKDDYNVKV